MRLHSSALARGRRSRTEVGTSPDEGETPLDVATIYREHAGAVGAWARRLGGPDVDVEDVVHEVFVVVQRRLGEWRGDARVTTWLYEITLRVVQERRRRGRWLRRRPPRTDEPVSADDLAQVASDTPDALELLQRREATVSLYRILDGIGEKYRTVIILFELEGLSGEEIAALTGTSLANVWVRLHRGRQKVMKRFLAWEAKGKP